MKIVHAADIHLDSPLRGLPDYEGAPVGDVRSATRRALSGLIELCLEENASLLLLAGDLYDGDFKDYSTALYLTHQVARLREIGCRVVWLRGNHDAQNKITRHLRLPDNAFELSTARPETRVFEDLGVAVHGQGYQSRDVLENLARTYPAPHAGLFNIGLLHTALDGSRGHDPYAPCTASELSAHGYDYWALGHVHQREVVRADPPIVYPGNLQGRHARETGPKGATVLCVEDGRLSRLEHQSVDVVRWAVCEVDATGAWGFADVVEAACRSMTAALEQAQGRTVACRVRIVGATRAHAELAVRGEELLAELRRFSLESGLYLERVQQRTRAEVVLEALLERGDAWGNLFQALRVLAEDPEAVLELKSAMTEGLGGISAELLRAEDFDEILAEAAQLLEGRLLQSPDREEA